MMDARTRMIVETAAAIASGFHPGQEADGVEAALTYVDEALREGSLPALHEKHIRVVEYESRPIDRSELPE